jgi:hypothetical protein
VTDGGMIAAGGGAAHLPEHAAHVPHLAHLMRTLTDVAGPHGAATGRLRPAGVFPQRSRTPRLPRTPPPPEAKTSLAGSQATAPTLRAELTPCRQGPRYAAVLGGAEPVHDFVLRRHAVHAPDADGQRAQHGHSPGHRALPVPSALLRSRLVSSPWHEANPPGMCKLLPFDVS